MSTETPPIPPSQNISVPMTVLTQYLKDLSFESPAAPGVLALLPQTAPQVNVNVTVAFRLLGNPPAGNPQAPATFEGTVTIKAEATVSDKERQDRPAFVVECVYGGVFALPQGLPDQVVRGLLMVEAPRLLFPFARAAVSDAVMTGGFGPLLIAPVDFMALHQQQMQNEKLAAGQAAGNA